MYLNDLSDGRGKEMADTRSMKLFTGVHYGPKQLYWNSKDCTL